MVQNFNMYFLEITKNDQQLYNLMCTYCENSMLMEFAEAFAIVLNAVVERTMVVLSLEGLDNEVAA